MSIGSIIEDISANQDVKVFKIFDNTLTLVNKKNIPAGTISYSSNLEKFINYINSNTSVSLGIDLSFDDTIRVSEGDITVLEVGLGKDFNWIKFKKEQAGIVLYGLCPSEFIVGRPDRVISPDSFKATFQTILDNGGTGTSVDKATPKTFKITDISANTISEDIIFDKKASTYATVVKTDIFTA